jgi:hypothetical protein
MAIISANRGVFMRVEYTRKDFLEALFQRYFTKREGFILVRAVRHLDHKISTRFFPNIELVAREQYQEEQHIYFGVCPRESMKPDKKHIRYMVALWVGMDLTSEGYSGRNRFFFGHAQAAKAIRSFPLPPSIIVESGWGVHLYWLLKQVTPIDDPAPVETVLKKINGYFQCSTEVGIDSVLRLPGTVNCKHPSQCVECRIKYINPDFSYDLEEFESLNLGEGAASMKSSAFVKSFPQESPHPPVKGDQNDAWRSPKAQAGPSTMPDEPFSSEHTFNSVSPVMDVVPDEIRGGSTVVVCAEESDDILADEIADKVVGRLSDRFTDKLADVIVEKLVKRLKSHPK